MFLFNHHEHSTSANHRFRLILQYITDHCFSHIGISLEIKVETISKSRKNVQNSMLYTIPKHDVKQVRPWSYFGAQLGRFWVSKRRPKPYQKPFKMHIVYIQRLVAENLRKGLASPPPRWVAAEGRR